MANDGDLVECPYCEGEYKGEKGLRIHQSSVHTDEVTVIVGCNWCGNDVEVKQWETDQNHYCGYDCTKAWNSYLRLGEKHPNYVDGTTRPRSYQWVAIAVRNRDQECRRCGTTSGAEDGRALHVHHIVPEDDSEDPHDPTNLLSVCGGCHRKLESLSPDEQLDECAIEDTSELALPSELSEWVKQAQENNTTFAKAPSPRPGMFSEAQKHINSDPRNDG